MRVGWFCRVLVALPCIGGLLSLGALLAQESPSQPAGPPPVAPLTEAVWKGDVERVRQLLAAGEDPTRPDAQDSTPWLWAISTRNDEALALLLEKVPAIPKDQLRGQRGLLLAAPHNNLDAARALLARDVAPDTPSADGSGTTALMVAAASGYTEYVSLLLDAGADARRQDTHGDSALMAAVRIGSRETVTRLLSRGARVDQKDQEGRTALLWAARTGRADVARVLLDAGASVDAADAAGHTPLQHAAEKGHTALVDLLRAQGAKSVTPRAERPAPSARAAVEKSLPLLQRSGQAWLDRQPCTACHHTPMIMRTTALARQHGFAVDDAMAGAQLAREREGDARRLPRFRTSLASAQGTLQLSLRTGGDPSFGLGWFESAFLEAGLPRDSSRETFALLLARMQLADGRWRHGMPRVPLESSDFAATANAVRVLHAYGPAERASELRERVQRAKQWLLSHGPETMDDRVSRLLGLRWSDADESAIKDAAAAVLREQNTDGGWPQVSGMNSDAYATGMVLVALHQARGIRATDAAYRRGVDYLLRTQEADGSWLVHKRAVPLNEYFESGFPHGKFQFISYAGSCWATMALIYAAL